MFKRPLKTKSHTSVKKSERKHLLEAISGVHQALSVDDLRKYFFPDGEDILCLKVEAAPSPPAAGPAKAVQNAPSTFHVYCNSKKQPFFASFDIIVSQIPKTTFMTTYIPTLYAIWQLPMMLPLAFITHAEVVAKLQKGAKLMLAGVAPTMSCLDVLQSSTFRKNEAYGAVVMSGVDVVVGVGRILMDSEEMKERLSSGGEMRGELMEMIHLVDDELWALGDKSIASDYKQRTDSVAKETEGLAAGERNEIEGDDAGERKTEESTSDAVPNLHSGDVSVNVDALCRKIFLTTLKSRISDGSLPMLLSTLNKHMLDISRRISDPPLEIKNTSYRKLGKFLEEMQATGVITLVKIKEGVEAVSVVDWKNALFDGIDFIPPDPVETVEKTLKMPASVRQVYVVNGRVAPLFQSVHQEMGKGFEFRSTEAVREVVTQYIKTRSLTSQTDRNVVNLDKLLVDLVLTKTMRFEGVWPMKWGEVFDKILKEMSINHEVVFTNGAFAELRGKFVPLEVKVEKKAGNKIVTVVRYFEGLGMDPQAIARELQQNVGATVGIREEGGPNNVISCVTIQGDQTKLLHKFFFQTHSVPTKFVIGLDKVKQEKLK